MGWIVFCVGLSSRAKLGTCFLLFSLSQIAIIAWLATWTSCHCCTRRLHSLLHAQQTLARRSRSGFLRANLGRHLRRSQGRPRRCVRDCLHCRPVRASRRGHGDFLPALSTRHHGQSVVGGSSNRFVHVYSLRFPNWGPEVHPAFW